MPTLFGAYSDIDKTWRIGTTGSSITTNKVDGFLGRAIDHKRKHVMCNSDRCSAAFNGRTLERIGICYGNDDIGHLTREMNDDKFSKWSLSFDDLRTKNGLEGMEFKSIAEAKSCATSAIESFVKDGELEDNSHDR